MADRFLSYGRQPIDDDDIAAVVEALRGDLLTTGPTVERFERAVAERVGAATRSPVNGTPACTWPARCAHRRRPEVVTAPITFLATANCVRLCGGAVVFADVDRRQPSMTPAGARAHARSAHPAVKAVMPVHFGGLASTCRRAARASPATGC